ncbi:MAG: PadR family transcriptional regulator [Acidimicrobiia bacterium]|nr:PadR family transcriptional regulator [Acidimicrobiia bacterium]
MVAKGPDRGAQLLKGVLDMCLLAVIGEQPSYGYEMVRKLSNRGLELVSEGTIYPVLSRLQKSGLVEGYLVESPAGPARKYYRISTKGRRALDDWSGDWKKLAVAVEGVLEGATGE